MQGQRDLELGIQQMTEKRTGNVVMDHFLSSIREVNDALEKISKNIEDIERFHRQALTAVTLEEATRLSRLIDELVNRTNNGAQQIRRTLKSLTVETDDLKQSGEITPSDLRLRANQQNRYAKKFMAIMNKFQTMQTTYQAKYRQQLERQYLIVKPTATREELDRLTQSSSSDATSMMNQQIFAMANKAQAQKTLAEMKERHQDIVAIEKSLRELHQMFVDMAMIVEQQGETLDKIEDHISNTMEYTETAAIEMRGAVSRQRGLQKKKWILLIICIIILAVVAIVLATSIPGKS